MDKDQNQLNFIINTIIDNKQGSLRRKDDSLSIVSNEIIKDEKEALDKFKSYNQTTIKNSTSTNYPIKINDSTGIINFDISDNEKVLSYITFNSIGITKEKYDKFNKIEQEKYNKQVQDAKELIEKNNIEYNKKVTELESQLSQLRRAEKISNNEKIYESVEHETYTNLSKESFDVLLLNKLGEICNTLSSIKEIALDNNHLLNELYNHNDNVNFEKVEKNINEGIIQVPKEFKKEYYEYHLPINPNINEDGSIDFFSESGYIVRIQKDYNSEPLQYDEQFKKNDKYEGIESININQVDNNDQIEYEFNENDKRISYDKYIYAPRKYLLKVIPNTGINQNCNDLNENDIVSNKISKYKACKHNVPIYGINAQDLMFPFENVPIIFKQSYQNIINDINDRILPINKLFAQDMIKIIENSKMKNIWNSKMSHLNRYILINSLYQKIKEECKDDFANPIK